MSGTTQESCLVSVQPNEAGLLKQLFVEMAGAIELPHPVSAKESDIRENFLSGEPGLAWFITFDEAIVGYVTGYTGINSSSAQPILFIDDIYLKEIVRRRGLGERVVKEMTTIAKGLGCRELRWQALKTNVVAQRFYQKIRADKSDEAIDYVMAL
ncbi:MAG TPA: GNAT family N-acetyltransferase [Marinobacter sp.]|uniref:GNAT family N-acetyltransferase n=1 Tax=Marinobacter sp. TaxID=50741 RepID=UPI002D80AEA0|nr:GNAT family N-acetyltransferase [Marinobacter sp.]HET8800351.1 GNAT family N-acetyltransferase [Marinobacter sp.]